MKRSKPTKHMAKEENPLPQKGDPFESAKGESFGGVQAILALPVGGCSRKLEYLREMKLPLKEDDGSTKLMNVPLAFDTEDADKRQYSMPIGAVFRKIWAEASPQPGDQFYVKRFDDASKKSGKGAGKPFHVYGIKIVQRAPRAAIAPATS